MKKIPTKPVDVTVLGGGPAGLLVAQKISPTLETALIERGSLGTTQKFWLTTQQRLVKHGLEGAIGFTTTRGTIGTFLGDQAEAIGDYAVVREKELLQILIARCKARKVKLIETTEALNVSKCREGIELTTSRGVIRSKLIIDASGGLSPIASTFRLHRIDGFYSIYGAHVTGIDLATDAVVGAHVIRFGNPAPLFELIPTSRNSAHCVVFVATKQLVNPQSLKGVFESHLIGNPFFRKTSAFHLSEPKLGAIPIGKPLRRRLPRVLPFGEAAMLQAPLLGAAFNEVLEHGDTLSEVALKAFRSAKDAGRLPRTLLPVKKRLNDRVQLHLARALVDGSVEDFSRLVDFLRRVGPDTAYRLFCTDLELTDWWRLATSYAAAKASSLDDPDLGLQ